MNKIINQTQFLNFGIIEFDCVSSTMIIAKDFNENTVIIAQSQSNGKGKTNRLWNSENNGNLYFSFSLNGNNERLDYSQLSFLSGVAMREAILNFNINNSILLKWPNDILINQKKCCGILLEFDTLSKKLVIGIGVNIKEFPTNVMFNSTSLLKENIIVEKYELLKEFLKNFDYLFNEWQKTGFSTIREKWINNCYKLGQTIKVNEKEGVFEDFDKDGTLILRTIDGVLHIKSGDIF
ncbi:MAG TPA: biotin--[acetyl-CoA-carboxylase] ligase [Rickettsiales bacterium]|nr:biotin--[acetyl-CoA-carboxylase] ligase [Rickettsiales bacterium]